MDLRQQVGATFLGAQEKVATVGQGEFHDGRFYLLHQGRMEEGEVFTVGLRGFKAVHVGDFVRWRFLDVRLRFAGITDGDRRRFVERFEQGVQNLPLLHASATVPSGSFPGLIRVCSCSPNSGVM